MINAKILVLIVGKVKVNCNIVENLQEAYDEAILHEGIVKGES